MRLNRQIVFLDDSASWQRERESTRKENGGLTTVAKISTAMNVDFD
jgi:hypothetical protein